MMTATKIPTDDRWRFLPRVYAAVERLLAVIVQKAVVIQIAAVAEHILIGGQPGGTGSTAGTAAGRHGAGAAGRTVAGGIAAEVVGDGIIGEVIHNGTAAGGAAAAITAGTAVAAAVAAAAAIGPRMKLTFEALA